MKIRFCVARRDAVKRELVPFKLPIAQAQTSEKQNNRIALRSSRAKPYAIDPHSVNIRQARIESSQVPCALHGNYEVGAGGFSPYAFTVACATRRREPGGW